MAKKTKDYANKPKVKVERSTKTEQYEKIFTIVEQNGNFLIAVADKIITKNTFATSDEAKAYIDSKPYELIVNATCLLYELSLEQKSKN